MAEERLQKILARAGFGSRRACEVLITDNRVKVNGQLAILGTKADPDSDEILVDGHLIPKIASENVYIALNKPRGVLSDNAKDDPRKNVHDLVSFPGHLFVVGRLDFDSEGLMLLTDDGELANRLTHPRYGHEKEYKVLVYTRPEEEQLTAWRRGVMLEDGYKTAPVKITINSLAGKGAWLKVIMKEGKKRQIREVGKTIGLPVQRIIRVRIGTVLLGQLKPGEWRKLSPSEVSSLRKSAMEKTSQGRKPVKKKQAR
jgi:23S rRNA pseudouridine2605 synthase